MVGQSGKEPGDEINTIVLCDRSTHGPSALFLTCVTMRFLSLRAGIRKVVCTLELHE